MKIVSRVRQAAGTAAMLLLLAGCAAALHGTTAEKIHTLRGRDAEATLYSGERVILRSPGVEGDSVFGGWTSGPSGDVRVALAIADIQGLRPLPMGSEDPDSPRGFTQNMLMAAGIVWALLLAGLVIGM
jgi:nitrous oxide reductase